jgi:hypothetical protein
MESKNQLIYRNYLQGKLNSTEKLQFESQLQSDEAFSDQFISVLIADYEDQRLRKLMRSEISAENDKSLSSSSGRFQVSLRWAALFLLFLLPTGLILKHYLQKNTTIITPEYAYYPSVSNMRGDSGEQVNTLANKAFQSYRNEDFLQAGKEFEAALESVHSLNDTQLHLYAAISFLRTNDALLLENASIHLEKVLAEDNPYNQAARWFLALTQYEMGKREEAQMLFQEIASAGTNFNSAKAKKILSEYY